MRTVRQFDYVTYVFYLPSLVCLCQVIEAQKNQKRLTRELARIPLLHLLIKDKFLWLSIPDIVTN